MKFKKHIFNFVSKMAFLKLRVLLSLRYRVSIEGKALLKSKSPLLFVPNHPALIDPLLLLGHIYRYTNAIPVITSSFYDLWFVKWFFVAWGAVRVSDLERGSRNLNVLDDIQKGVLKAFDDGKNVVLYPAGQIARQPHERILNKKSVHEVVSQLPNNVRVVGVRITGLWGSATSRAGCKKEPCLFNAALKGAICLLPNLIFLVPKRHVIIEFEDITPDATEQAKLGRSAFNTFLEGFLNSYGDEPISKVPLYFFCSRK